MFDQQNIFAQIKKKYCKRAWTKPKPKLKPTMLSLFGLGVRFKKVSYQLLSI